MVFNQHQPSSDNRPFRQGARIRFCKQLLHAGVAEHCADPTNIAVVFGGDAKCNRGVWSAAIAEETSWKQYFKVLSPIFAREAVAANPILARTGDCHIAMGIDGFDVRQEDCWVRNSNPRHDCIIVKWHYETGAFVGGAAEHTKRSLSPPDRTAAPAKKARCAVNEEERGAVEEANRCA